MQTTSSSSIQHAAQPQAICGQPDRASPPGGVAADRPGLDIPGNLHQESADCGSQPRVALRQFSRPWLFLHRVERLADGHPRQSPITTLHLHSQSGRFQPLPAAIRRRTSALANQSCGSLEISSDSTFESTKTRFPVAPSSKMACCFRVRSSNGFWIGIFCNAAKDCIA